MLTACWCCCWPQDTADKLQALRSSCDADKAQLAGQQGPAGAPAMQAGQESDLATMRAELDSMQQTLQERQKKLDAQAVDLGAATE